MTNYDEELYKRADKYKQDINLGLVNSNDTINSIVQRVARNAYINAATDQRKRDMKEFTDLFFNVLKDSLGVQELKVTKVDRDDFVHQEMMERYDYIQFVMEQIEKKMEGML